MKNDQERICDKEIVALKQSRYFLSPSDHAGGLPLCRELLRGRGTTKNNQPRLFHEGAALLTRHRIVRKPTI
jgi:hypothetical protein